VKTDLIDKSLANLATAAKPPKRRLRRVVGYLVAILILAVGAVLYAPQYFAPYLPQAVVAHLPQAGLLQSSAPAGRGGRGARAGNAPVPILVAAARKADVPVYFDGVGSSRALNTVTVRTQVDGKLMSVNFKEGQDVDDNFVLADIEPTIYQAQYDQAVAKKAMDEAQLANARVDLDRYARLTQTNAVTHQQYDTQKALVAQLEAQVQLDQGAIDNAKAVLSYTKIVAPLAGRTGLRLVDAGNIVHASDTTGIVVITQIKPIAVIFTLPQQQLAKVNKAFGRSALGVQALGDDNRTVVDRGTLQVIDNQVDQTTGTVKLKAEFPNLDLQLWPGEFVNVKLLVDTLKEVLVIPSVSVQRGPNGTFVYVANDDNTVGVHPVTVAQQDDTEAVVSTGVADGDRVVTTGFSQLTDGAAIVIGSPENLERPAGSERRRAPRKNPATASNEQAPRTEAPRTAPPPNTPGKDAPAGEPKSAAPEPAGNTAKAAETPRDNQERRSRAGG
jgi:membrane fusion protein, multidrug efflux system